MALTSVPMFLLNDPDFDMGSDGGGRGLFSDTVVNGTAVPDSAAQSEAGSSDSPLKGRVRQK